MEKHRTDGVKKKCAIGCSQCCVLIVSCALVGLLASLTGYTLWRLASYDQTITLLQNRVSRLENEHIIYETNIENIVKARVDIELKKVSRSKEIQIHS